MYGKMQEFGLSEIIPLICTLAIYGRIVFLHPESSQGAQSRQLQWLMVGWQQLPLFTNMTGGHSLSTSLTFKHITISSCTVSFGSYAMYSLRSESIFTACH